jgi:hypothetical protein
MRYNPAHVKGNGGALMFEPSLRFPVKCPICQTEALTSIPLWQVADALANREPISLRAVCHEIVWTATQTEMDQIREYLKEVSRVNGGARF